MDEYNDALPPSKTQLKQDASALQEKAERLMTLKPEQLARLPLHPDLSAAIEESRRISKADARRRHALFVAKQMRAGDLDTLLEALDNLDDPLREKRLLQWTDQVAAADDLKQAQALIGDVMNWFADCDRQHLRNLVRELLQARPPADSTDAEQRKQFKRRRKRLMGYLLELDRQAPLYIADEDDWQLD